MKKTKIIVSVFTFCVAILALCFGVYAATSVNYKASGTVTYKVGTAKVQVTTSMYKAKTGFNSAYNLKTEADKGVKATGTWTAPTGWEQVDIVKATPEEEDDSTKTVTFNTTVTEGADKYQAGVSDQVTGLSVVYEEQKYESYYIVISITSLDDLNTFARIRSEKLGAGINSHVYGSAGYSSIAKGTTATMVIAFALDDASKDINGVTFEYEIEIGAGVMPTDLVQVTADHKVVTKDSGLTPAYWGVSMGVDSSNNPIVWKLVSIDNGVSQYTFNKDVVPAGLGVFVLESTNAGLAAQASIDAAQAYMNSSEDGGMIKALKISSTMYGKLTVKTVNKDEYVVDGNDFKYTVGDAITNTKFYLLSESEALNLLGNLRPADVYTYNNAGRTALGWNNAAYLLRTTNKTVGVNGAIAAGVSEGTAAVRPAFTLAV